YRDIVYFYPPLTPYALAAVTSVIGHSIASYVFIGIAIAAATATLIYVIVRRVANDFAAVTAAATFPACSVAGPSTGGCNYLFPYAHAATIAMLLFLGMLAALLAERLPLAIVLGVAASWTKVEFAIFALIVLLVARIGWRWLAAYLALHAVVFAIVSFV